MRVRHEPTQWRLRPLTLASHSSTCVVRSRPFVPVLLPPIWAGRGHGARGRVGTDGGNGMLVRSPTSARSPEQACFAAQRGQEQHRWHHGSSAECRLARRRSCWRRRAAAQGRMAPLEAVRKAAAHQHEQERGRREQHHAGRSDSGD